VNSRNICQAISLWLSHKYVWTCVQRDVCIGVWCVLCGVCVVCVVCVCVCGVCVCECVWCVCGVSLCVCVCACVCSLSCPACNARAPYCHLWPALFCNIFPYYLIKETIFEKKMVEHKMWVLISHTKFILNISHSEKNWARYDKNVHRSTRKVPVIIIGFERKLNLLDILPKKNTKIPIFMKMRLEEVELFHEEMTDGQTWRSWVPFSNFWKEPKRKCIY
jgi:hypothetical protein